MKKRVLSLLLTAVLLFALSAPALAVEEDVVPVIAMPPAGISVQLDGQIVTFTDAEPEVVDQRTFLPFRAVFEAMGAEVDYEDETQTVVAVRGDTTLRMPVASKEAAVTVGDTVTALPMDVAPYVKVVDEGGGGRTYVPVRFAAQAFGCAVGWDQDDQTVLIVDTEKLLGETLAKYEFTLMEKYAAYNEQFQTENWNIKAEFEASAAFMAMAPMLFSGTMTGVMAEGTKAEMDMTMKLDLEDFLASISALFGESALSEEDLAMITALKEDGIGMQIRFDMDAGVIYLALTGDFITDLMGLAEDTWLAMDMDAMYAEMGLDYTGLMDAANTMDATELLAYTLTMVELNDKDSDYEMVHALVDGVATFLSDESFARDGNNYTSSYLFEEEGVKAAVAFTLVMQGDEVKGYDMSVEVTGEATEDGQPVTMTVTGFMDSDNKGKTEFRMDMAGLMTMDMTMDMAYTTTDEVPATAPPEGAVVVDFMELMGSTAGAEPAEPVA